MGKFIDRQKLEAHFSPAITGKDAYTAGEVLLSIQKFPSADVVPVIHAQWTRKRTQEHDGELYCSNCEWTPEVLGGTTLGDLQLADVYYCPNCGAKMDEVMG